ncbi:MAG: ATP-binding protein [Prevotella sp.]|nr:ATP-binding protein [Candidatus Equicola faecalis]
MIQEFQVQNFYSIRESQTINFLPNNDENMREQYVHEVAEGVKLLKIGIVYGSNASGKTTILNALSFFRSIMIEKPESKNDGMGYSPFLLDKHSEQEHSHMQMTFWINGEKYVLSITFDSKRIYEESLMVYTSVRPTTLYKRFYQPDTDHSEVLFSSKVGIDKISQRAITGNTTNNCTVMAAFRESNTITSKLNDVSYFFEHNMQALLTPRNSLLHNVRNELHNDHNGEKKQFLLRLLRASDFNIVDMTLNEREDTITEDIELAIKSAPLSEEAKLEMLKRGTIKYDDIVFLHTGEGGKYELNEQLESAGTHRFLGMSIVLYYVLHENNFIPIDEIETSIHYELLSYFIKLFLANSEGSSQILMTTHDINLLNEDFIRRDVVWFTDKSEVGATQIKRLSSLGLHKTMNAYNAYKQGKLVDLPFLGSVYLETE